MWELKDTKLSNPNHDDEFFWCLNDNKKISVTTLESQ